SRVTAAVTKLYRGLCAGTVDRVDKPTQPGQKAVVVNTKLEIPMLSGALGRGHFDRDEADASLRARPVIGDCSVGDEPFRISVAGCHRSHDHAVLERDRPDLARQEQTRNWFRHRRALNSVHQAAA